MNSLVPINNLNFENSLVRTYNKEGEILFCLADCLKAINSKTTTTAGLALIYEGLGEGYVSNIPLETTGGTQEIIFIAESALTFLIARSRTELGKKFNRWIHCEVLPSIRKTGGYQTKPSRDVVEYTEVIEKIPNLKCSEALKQLLLDKAGDELSSLSKNLLSPAKGTSLIGVAQKAEQMGFTLTHSNRGILGKYVKKMGLNPISEDRLVNGQLRQCLVYENNLALESAITDFFSQKV